MHSSPRPLLPLRIRAWYMSSIMTFVLASVIGNGHNGDRKSPSLFRMVPSLTPYDLPFPGASTPYKLITSVGRRSLWIKSITWLRTLLSTNRALHGDAPQYLRQFTPVADIPSRQRWSSNMYTVSPKKLCHFFTAYNFRNIEQIFTKFGTNQSLFILSIVPELSTLENSGAI